MNLYRADVSGSLSPAGVLGPSIEAEQEEKRCKERKKLREHRQVDAEEALCVHPGCVVVAVSEQGWFNTPCTQKHMLSQKAQFHFCGQSFHCLGPNNQKIMQEETHTQHKFLACTTTSTCGKRCAYCIWMDGWMDGVVCV